MNDSKIVLTNLPSLCIHVHLPPGETIINSKNYGLFGLQFIVFFNCDPVDGVGTENKFQQLIRQREDGPPLRLGSMWDLEKSQIHDVPVMPGLPPSG